MEMPGIWVGGAGRWYLPEMKYIGDKCSGTFGLVSAGAPRVAGVGGVRLAH